MPYSIIIPIHNEEKYIPRLLDEIKPFSYDNEILIIDDGSKDNSNLLLKKCNFIKFIRLEQNNGKGFAIKTGLKNIRYEKVLIFDGDLELKTSELAKLMVLNNNTKFVLGERFKSDFFSYSLWNFGNFFLTNFFNFRNNTILNDALCCAKSFYKTDIKVNSLKSNKFDIDVEITSKLIKKHQPKNVLLSYTRRNFKQGKKLRLADGWIILFRIITS